MEEMLDIYRANYSLYEDFTNQMQQFVSQLLQQQNIRIHSVHARVKTAASLQQKIVSHPQYTQLEEITDLCGLRIITYFEDDVDRVGAILHEKLTIDPVNSVDKRKLLAPNQFGYLSLHVVAGLPADILQNPQYIKFRSCKIEIQICSMLQHAWAEIEHDLGYKASSVIPYAARRSFSRLAGLLEIADGEFKHLRSQLQPEISPQPSSASAPALTHEALVSSASMLLPKKMAGVTRKTTFLAGFLKGYRPLGKAVGHTLVCTLLLLAVYCLVDESHFIQSLLIALKIEKHTLFALASNYLHG